MKRKFFIFSVGVIQSTRYVSVTGKKVRFQTRVFYGPPLCLGPPTTHPLGIGNFLPSVNNVLLSTIII